MIRVCCLVRNSRDILIGLLLFGVFAGVIYFIAYQNFLEKAPIMNPMLLFIARTYNQNRVLVVKGKGSPGLPTFVPPSEAPGAVVTRRTPGTLWPVRPPNPHKSGVGIISQTILFLVPV